MSPEAADGKRRWSAAIAHLVAAFQQAAIATAPPTGKSRDMHASRAMIEAKQMLTVAREEALRGKAEGGIPIGAALYGPDGELLGRGHNRRVQDGDPSMHAETAAFRDAGRRANYRDTVMVTTLSPCWYCSGLVRQFNISRVVIGEARTFSGGHDWLAEHGVEVTIVDDPDCFELMSAFISEHPELWYEDIGS